MSTPTLFRKEALAERRTPWLGTVLLAPRLSHRVFAVCALLATAGLVALLRFGEYPRKSHITGLLVPDTGVVQVFAPQAGVVTQIFVKEGDEVQKGDRLMALSAELESVARGATQSDVARHLVSRRESLAQERRARERLGDEQMRSLSERIDASRGEQEKLKMEMALQRSRIELAQKSVARAKALKNEGLASDEQVQAAEEALLEQHAKLGTFERNRVSAERERLVMTGERDALPLKTRAEVATIDQSVAALEQQLAEVEARREIIVPAPASGTVTAIQAEQGGRPDAKAPLLLIVPTGSKLEAHLFCPSRAVGFLRTGQRALLRYQSFPYQKFGHHDGTITSVSRSAVNPSELPPQLAGMTGVVAAGEPIYRVTVNLSRQTITAYGQPTPLQPGMQLDADVVLERRRLFEWMLEPLYTLTGTWQR